MACQKPRGTPGVVLDPACWFICLKLIPARILALGAPGGLSYFFVFCAEASYPYFTWLRKVAIGKTIFLALVWSEKGISFLFALSLLAFSALQ